MRTDIFREYKVLFSMGTVFLLPFSIVTQMLFVLSFKLMTVNIIELLKRTGGYRVRIQSTLLKKRQTQPSAVCLLW